MSLAVSYAHGFGAGAGLIIAIGAQNAYVLTQSIRRNHHLLVCLVCSLCDAALISLGVLGVGELVAASPLLLGPAAWGGAAFLGWYGWGALRAALRGGALEQLETGMDGARRIVAATLAVSLLNPHVYLDTVVILGSVSGQHAGPGRYLFGLGAMTASFIWFYGLGLGGRMLAPVFRRPATWRVLNGLVCLTMWGIAASLLRMALAS